MIDLKDFLNVVDTKFWTHITKQTLILGEETLDRTKVLTELVSAVNAGTYVPKGPKDFVIYNKSRDKLNRVARIVPSFYAVDYSLIYYLLKKLEPDLSENIQSHAYGSFRNFKYFKDKEDGNAELLGWDFLPSIASTSSYYKNYWIFEWREFMGKARKLYLNKKYQYFLSFDIADFYPSITLQLLDKKLRGSVAKEKQIYVDILMYFLHNSNNKLKNYIPESKGIPQDEVGDCSRVLANFYLQDFDRKINDFAIKNGAEVLRFADDHIIFARSETDATKILFYSSIQLQKIGLSINSNKISDFKNRTQFINYWSFDIHELMDKNKWAKASKKYLSRDKKIFKWSSILLRFLHSNAKRIGNGEYLAICSEYTKNELINNLDAQKMVKLYKFIPSTQKSKFLGQLNQLYKICDFNSYHYNLLKAIKKNSDFQKYFNKSKIQAINKRIIDLSRYFEI